MQDVKLDAAVPGQSLTNDPDNPYPFERPPQFVDKQEAQEYIFDSLMEPEKLKPLLDFITAGIPITTLAQMVLFAGFSKGKWNPDMVLLLLEPTVYILLFICEQAGIDYVLSEDDGELGIAGEIEFNHSITGGKIAELLGVEPDEVDIAAIDKAKELLEPSPQMQEAGGLNEQV